MNRQQQLINQRAIAMAYLQLSERKDLDVREATDGQGGYDLFHYIVRLPHHKRGLRQFAVESVGVVEAIDRHSANKELAAKTRVVSGIGPYPFPTLLFLFSMRDDAGWYTWVSEPQVKEEGAAALSLRKKPDCHPLDRGALDEIVSRVDEWYDHHYAALVTGTVG